jgi:hypothetical protein
MLLVHWIIGRGDWILDSISTFFEYVGFSSAIDRKVARAIAGNMSVERVTQELNFIRQSFASSELAVLQLKQDIPELVTALRASQEREARLAEERHSTSLGASISPYLAKLMPR